MACPVCLVARRASYELTASPSPFPSLNLNRRAWQRLIVAASGRDVTHGLANRLCELLRVMATPSDARPEVEANGAGSADALTNGSPT